MAAAVAMLPSSASFAGHGGGRIAAVGGVSINADGVLAGPILKDRELLRQEYQKQYKAPAPELNQPVGIRKFSLREAEAAMARSGKNLTWQMPPEIHFMAGLQRIQYVFIYPDDIVLAGPGEGWRVDENANMVGITTGRPVLRLEDFLVALRSVDNAREEGITVSIDPTAEGRQRFEQYMRKQTTFNPGVLDGIAKALGQQQITITGVPDTSRFARILAASDYKMKRIAMGLEESPLAELPSFLTLMKKDRVKLDNMMPRWWMACNYEPLGKSADGLAWEIRGPGVKVMTEDEIIGEDGSVTGTGKVNPVAQKWSTLMTEYYDELAAKEPVFGELRNLMDLCVVAALIKKEGMEGRHARQGKPESAAHAER
jgi:hypothetical protein